MASEVAQPQGQHRSATGRHILLPASEGLHSEVIIPIATQKELITFTFGRGTVLMRLWPAVLLHTLFAAAVVTISMKTSLHLGIPSVLLTVLGVVIGFVISYRASSGYDRYWMGRTSWTDIIRNVRTLSRHIWFHVPPRLTPLTQEEKDAHLSGTANRELEELNHVMAEKRMALDLLEGFVIALKHHLRGEMGIYYEDLYPLVRPLHNHPRHARKPQDHPGHTGNGSSTGQKHQNVHEEATPVATHDTLPSLHKSKSTKSLAPSTSTAGPSVVDISASSSRIISDSETAHLLPINPTGQAQNEGSTSNLTFPDPSTAAYGTFARSQLSLVSSNESGTHGSPLLPARVPRQDGVLGHVSASLVPFSSLFGGIKNLVVRLRGRKKNLDKDTEQQGIPIDRELSIQGQEDHLTHRKHRPRIAGGGENLPLDILRCFSEWCSVLEERGTCTGNGLGWMFTILVNLEENLSTLEKILTTPLPFVYSVHIKHTVWIYLFFLPFQLVDTFGWYTIPGVGIAAFIYLGFLAAGEEIEQPFGYDDNDLDLDLFYNEIIHADIETLKRTPCHNVYLPEHKGHNRVSIVEAARERQAAEANVFAPGALLTGPN